MLLPFTFSIPPFMQMIGNLHNRTPDSIKYLPAVFHGEAEERHSPLWALLLTIEHFFGQIEDRIKHIEQNFDIYQAHTFSGEARENKDFLSWLFTWVAFDPDQSWSEQKKRYVLGKAAELYTYRGTITGLRYMLDLFFGIEVEVSEWTWPRGMQVGVQNTIGIDTVLHEKPNLNHCFVITWHVPPSESGAALRQKVKKIRALIDRERPGHTRCYFAVRNQLRNREGKRK